MLNTFTVDSEFLFKIFISLLKVLNLIIYRYLKLVINGAEKWEPQENIYLRNLFT